MTIREATIEDIPQIQIVRNSVKENRLSSPDRVTDKDCEDHLTILGKGWVAVADYMIIGFAIVDLSGRSVWALFLLPEFENKGYGKKLHTVMMDWYFTLTREPIWLKTASNTRAETFYNKNGWTEIEFTSEEIKFEMNYDEWTEYKMRLFG